MNATLNLLLTALAPVIWGTTYITTTEFLPEGMPITMAMLRALPAGLLLLLLVRKVPKGAWWWKSFALGALNFTVFWTLLFVAAYRLPGGVAAVLGSVQPLIVFLLAYMLLHSSIGARKIMAAFIGIVGVALLMLKSSAALDWVGVAAGLGSALSMAFGVVLTRKWSDHESAPPLLTLTAWQLTAGGLLLVPLSYFLEPSLPILTLENCLAIGWLGLFGAALSYIFWFHGLSKIDVTIVSVLGFLSPLTAIMLDWLVLGNLLTLPQILGVALVFVSLVLNQKSFKLNTFKRKG